MDFKPTLIAKVLALWTAVLLVFSWLPLVRCVFDGDTYRWGTSHFGFSFSAEGIGPDLWLPVVKSGVFFFLLCGLLRGAGVIHRALMVLGYLAWPIDGVLAYFRNPEGLMFHGDTLGIHLNLGKLVPIVTGVFALLTLVWAAGESNRDSTKAGPGWTNRNRRLLVIWLLLLPVQFVLLRFGAPHGTTDAIGVFITIAQCPLLVAALYPWKT